MTRGPREMGAEAPQEPVQPLGAEFEAVWDANRAWLYEDAEEPRERREGSGGIVPPPNSASSPEGIEWREPEPVVITRHLDGSTPQPPAESLEGAAGSGTPSEPTSSLSVATGPTGSGSELPSPEDEAWAARVAAETEEDDRLWHELKSLCGRDAASPAVDRLRESSSRADGLIAALRPFATQPDGDLVERVAAWLSDSVDDWTAYAINCPAAAAQARKDAREVIALVRGAPEPATSDPQPAAGFSGNVGDGRPPHGEPGSRNVPPRSTLTDEQYETFFGCCPDAEPDDAPEPTPSAEEIWERVRSRLLERLCLSASAFDWLIPPDRGAKMIREALAELEKAR